MRLRTSIKVVLLIVVLGTILPGPRSSPPAQPGAPPPSRLALGASCPAGGGATGGNQEQQHKQREEPTDRRPRPHRNGCGEEGEDDGNGDGPIVTDDKVMPEFGDVNQKSQE